MISLIFPPKTYFYNISVYSMQGPSGHLITSMKWENLLFPVVTKWRWYFQYREALLRVQYPKSFIDVRFGAMDAHSKPLDIIIKNKIAGKKRSITKWKNIKNQCINDFEKFQKNYSKLFPIQSDNDYIEFQKTLNILDVKINKLNKELMLIQN